MNIWQECMAMELLPGMKVITGITLMKAYRKAYEITIDWHEFSNLLDHLHTIKLLDVVGHNNDGMTQYRLIKEF